MLKFAANLSWLFKEHAFLDRFAAAADAGFTAVEYLFPYDHRPDEIARHLSRHKLQPVLFNLPRGDSAKAERGLACIPGRESEFRASVAMALEYARATGVPRLHLMSGVIAGDRVQALATYKDALRFACEQAAAHGIDIMIEPLNVRDAPGYLMNDFGLANRLIAELKLSNLKLQFDIYHRQIIHGDIIRGLESMMPITGHIQISSVPNRNEPTSGELDDRRVLQTIQALNYCGFIGCEYTPLGATLAGLGWMRELSAHAPSPNCLTTD
ncbi:MAG TPA: TIM barrel protein [Rhizomicrobium sp.]|nr:TIM barrel protein [Rhizomicrobium sp.]